MLIVSLNKINANNTNNNNNNPTYKLNESFHDLWNGQGWGWKSKGYTGTTGAGHTSLEIIFSMIYLVSKISSAETCLRVIRGKEYSGYDTLEVRRENVLKII